MTMLTEQERIRVHNLREWATPHNDRPEKVAALSLIAIIDRLTKTAEPTPEEKEWDEALGTPLTPEEDAALMRMTTAVLAPTPTTQSSQEVVELMKQICLICGKETPCMTEADLKPDDPGIPCTFEPECIKRAYANGVFQGRAQAQQAPAALVDMDRQRGLLDRMMRETLRSGAQIPGMSVSYDAFISQFRERILSLFGPREQR